MLLNTSFITIYTIVFHEYVNSRSVVAMTYLFFLSTMFIMDFDK